MTAAKRYGRGTAPGGQRHLNRAFGSPESQQQRFLFPMSKDALWLADDFFGTLSTLLWTTAADASGTAFAQANVVDGVIEGATGTASQKGISLRGPRGFSGAANCG